MVGHTGSLSQVEQHLGIADFHGVGLAATETYALACGVELVVGLWVDIQVVRIFADIHALHLVEQVVGTPALTACRVVVIGGVVIPYIVPQHIVVAGVGVAAGRGIGVAVESPIDTGEGKGAVETRVAVHEGQTFVVGDGRSLQLAVVGIALGFLAVGHREEVNLHGRRHLTVVAQGVGRPCALLPDVVALVVGGQVGGVLVINGYIHGLGVVGDVEEHLGPSRTVDAGIVLVGQSVAAGVDGRQCLFHEVVGIFPALLVVVSVEERTCPHQQYTSLEGKTGAGGHPTPVGS